MPRLVPEIIDCDHSAATALFPHIHELIGEYHKPLGIGSVDRTSGDPDRAAHPDGTIRRGNLELQLL